MKKSMLKMSTILLASLFAISATQMLGANATVNNVDAVPALGQKIPLSNDQIKATWPNLPTAKQIYDNEVCVVIDLRYCGKQVSSMDEAFPDPNSPTVIDLASTIVNCTTTIADYVNGGVRVNTPQIWLQYDSNIWVQVPSKYLQTTMTPNGAVDQTGSTWAVGMYANPQQITGSYDVWGVCTFGQWNWATFGTSGMYLGTNVLTVCSNNIGYQEVMQLDSGGRKIVYNVWDLSSGQLLGAGGTNYITNAITGNLYNMYIRYTTGAGWQMWWNQTLFWTITGDTSTRVRTGNQTNVVVESNDFTPSHFSGFSTNVGGTYIGYPLCAAVYLFNGNWKPSATGDYAPAGYTYLGGTMLNGIAIGTQAPPNNWGSLNIGQTSSLRERFTVGAGLTQRSHGYTLWTYGTV
ncbi:hypothetical protein G4O51_07375 [Candidatus Bathyarchaeota archaeon A05DMB-2]|jgi:hypothetical protein|nr:hypothetical protein [Candidatus Bathyarchaeota archaeon A05DMB-2]